MKEILTSLILFFGLCNIVWSLQNHIELTATYLEEDATVYLDLKNLSDQALKLSNSSLNNPTVALYFHFNDTAEIPEGVSGKFNSLVKYISLKSSFFDDDYNEILPDQSIRLKFSIHDILPYKILTETYLEIERQNANLIGSRINVKISFNKLIVQKDNSDVLLDLIYSDTIRFKLTKERYNKLLNP